MRVVAMEVRNSAEDWELMQNGGALSGFGRIQHLCPFNIRRFLGHAHSEEMSGEDISSTMEKSLEQAETAVQELYELRDHYFEHNPIEKAHLKNEQVDEKLKETLAVLDYVQENTAKCLFLRGKALNVKPEYNPLAQDALSKAVKLEPKLVDAWNCLGECFWKKGDVEAAKNCFTGALSHGKSKESLRNLSMVLRQLGKDPSERLDNIKLGVEKAKEAVSCDVKDGISWYILGNAYLSLFFSGAQSPQILKQCMTAYCQAEKDVVSANSPDLHFNRAMAYKYQEDYQAACEGFRKAEAFDPTWTEPSEQRKKLVHYLSQVLNLVNGKGKLKPKRLQSMVQSLSQAELGPYAGGSYTSPSNKTVQLQQHVLAELNPEVNINKVLLGRMVGSVPLADPLPYTFALVDTAGQCWPVTVYNLSAGAGLVVGDSVAIPEPFVQVTDMVEDGQTFKFSSIRVDNPVVLVVNKKKLGVDKVAPSVLSVTAKSE